MYTYVLKVINRTCFIVSFCMITTTTTGSAEIIVRIDYSMGVSRQLSGDLRAYCISVYCGMYQYVAYGCVEALAGYRGCRMGIVFY